MLKAAFPLTVLDPVATYEIPYGTITRSTQQNTSWEKAQIEVPAQRWADISAAGYGVSLLTKTKHGFDIKENVVRLSLLRSPKWPDPTADRGKHSIEYALYPHHKTWKEAGTVRRGLEYNRPLLAVMTTPHKGSLPPTHAFVAAGPSNIILTSIKKEEEGNAWVLQWYESEGKGTEAAVTLPVNPVRAVISNFLEEDGTAVPFQGNKLTVPTKAHAVVTVKVWF
jgi:alpha-mannosidase